MQWTSYRDSRDGEDLIMKYKQDLLRRPPPVHLPSPRIDERTLGVVPLDTDVSIEYSTTTSITRVIHVKPKAWLRVDINGKYIPTLRVIEKSLRGIKSEKVSQDSALRNIPLPVSSYPDMTYRVKHYSQLDIVDSYELVLQYLHRVYGHIPVARLRNILEYYRVDEVIRYPGEHWK